MVVQKRTIQPTDFGQLITDEYQNLTKSEKQIADYFRKNEDEVAFLSAAEVAERLFPFEDPIGRSIHVEEHPAAHLDAEAQPPPLLDGQPGGAQPQGVVVPQPLHVHRDLGLREDALEPKLRLPVGIRGPKRGRFRQRHR